MQASVFVWVDIQHGVFEQMKLLKGCVPDYSLASWRIQIGCTCILLDKLKRFETGTRDLLQYFTPGLDWSFCACKLRNDGQQLLRLWICCLPFLWSFYKKALVS